MRLSPPEVQLLEQVRKAPDGALMVLVVKEGNRVRQAVVKKEKNNQQVIDKKRN